MVQHFKAVAAEIWAAKIVEVGSVVETWAVVDLVAVTWAVADLVAVDLAVANLVAAASVVKVVLVMAIMACKTI